MVGEPRIRAFSGILSDPPLPENAERVVLRGDSSAEIPRLVASTRALLDNLDAMTAPNASINTTLASLSTLSARLNGQHGMLTGLLGTPLFMNIVFRQGDPLINGTLTGLPLQAVGVGNLQLNIINIGGAVPEPSSWAMLIIGFGLVGATLRRRRGLVAA